jgi:leucyl-tRNA synthetase
VQTLRGQVSISMKDAEMLLPAGQAVTLASQVPHGLSELEAVELALKSDRVASFLDHAARPRRVIYVPDRLINLVP